MFICSDGLYLAHTDSTFLQIPRSSQKHAIRFSSREITNISEQFCFTDNYLLMELGNGWIEMAVPARKKIEYEYLNDLTALPEQK